MSEYALRLANGADTAARARASDALGMTPNGAVRARGGLRPDGGGAVTVVTGTMSVQVSPFSCWVDASPAGQVGYPFVCDASKTLAIAPGDATQVRVDTVAVVIKENAFDGTGTTAATLQIVQGVPGAGAPAMPTSACIPLRDINVPAGASAGSGGLAAGALAADRRVYTVASGGTLPCLSTARPASPYDGQTIYCTDLDQVQVYNAGAARWDMVGPMGVWVDDLLSPLNYNHAVTTTVVGTAIANGGPFNIVVPAGRTLEVDFRAPLFNVSAGQQLYILMRIAGSFVDSIVVNPPGQGGSLRGLYVGTGASVAVQVEALRPGSGAVNIQSDGNTPVRIRHRIT